MCAFRAYFFFRRGFFSDSGMSWVEFCLTLAAVVLIRMDPVDRRIIFMELPVAYQLLQLVSIKDLSQLTFSKYL